MDAEIKYKLGNAIKSSVVTAAAVDGLASLLVKQGVITSEEYRAAIDASYETEGYKELIADCDKMIEEAKKEIEFSNSWMRAFTGKATDEDREKMNDLLASFFTAGGTKDESEDKVED